MSQVLSRGISGREYPFTMIPFLDLANHSISPNAVVVFNDKTGVFTLQAIRDIPAEEEITISYGDARQNSSIVGLYGFYEDKIMTDDLSFKLSLDPTSDSTGTYAIITKVSLQYYKTIIAETKHDLSSEERNSRLNVCRVVLKDAR